jgi:hypothetical protein
MLEYAAREDDEVLMSWESRRRCLTAIPLLIALVSCAELAPREPGDHSGSLMTGTIAERNVFIARVLADESDPVQQINMQKLSLEVALEYLTNHLKIDAVVDWGGLAREGISRDDAKTTLVLFDATYADGLRAILWQMRPRTGSIGYVVENGKLSIRPLPPFVWPHTTKQKVADQRVSMKLAEVLDPPPSLRQARAVDAQFYALGFAKKMSIVVDWDELTPAGAKRDTPATPRPAGIKTEAYLTSLIDALSQNGPAVAYDIRHGMVRVSTRARLDAEHALERAAP